MKSIGVVRKLDELGRIVLPAALRKNLNIREGDGFEIFTDKDRIVLAKFVPRCIFCGVSKDELKRHQGKRICLDCTQELRKTISHGQ